MPNYITNKLTIIGSKEQIREVMDFIKVEKTEENQEVFGLGTIDFNKITPMPKWVFDKNLGKEDEVKYGAENCWLEWSRKNWGTKWNAFSQLNRKNAEDIIYFETAWDGVPDLIQKLAWIFPDIEIEYSYCDEDFGSNLGRYRFKDTEILEEYLPESRSNGAYELAFEITRTTPEENNLFFNPDTGTYEYKDEE